MSLTYELECTKAGRVQWEGGGGSGEGRRDLGGTRGLGSTWGSPCVMTMMTKMIMMVEEGDDHRPRRPH